MNTTDSKDGFDYQAQMRATVPDPAEVRKGTGERRKRRELAKARITIRIDHDIIEQFKNAAGDGGYQRLMNQALRDWLVAQGVKELVRSELKSLVGEVRSVVHELDR